MGRPKGSKNKPKLFFVEGSKAATNQATKTANARAENGKLYPKRRFHPATAEMNYTADELEFMNAMAEYIRTSGHKFPTWSEALFVARSLGYHRDANVLPLCGRDEVSKSEESGRLGFCAHESP